MRGRVLGSDAQACWLAAVLVLLGGFFFVFRAGQTRLASQRALNVQTARRLAANETIVRERDTLLEERTALRRRLSRYALAGDATSTVASFVRNAARIAGRHHTTVAALAARAREPGAGPASAFDAIPLDVTLEGRYVDVLATLRELSSSRVLAAVDIASIARTNLATPDATVRAAVSVAIERLVPQTVADVRAGSP